jgi:hypothetical protein
MLQVLVCETDILSSICSVCWKTSLVYLPMCIDEAFKQEHVFLSYVSPSSGPTS